MPPVLALVLLIAVGAALFVTTAQLCGALDLAELKTMLRRRRA
jgi:hypothetical protein